VTQLTLRISSARIIVGLGAVADLPGRHPMSHTSVEKSADLTECELEQMYFERAVAREMAGEDDFPQ
jgi:hypothetical protein